MFYASAAVFAARIILPIHCCRATVDAKSKKASIFSQAFLPGDKLSAVSLLDLSEDNLDDTSTQSR